MHLPEGLSQLRLLLIGQIHHSPPNALSARGGSAYDSTVKRVFLKSISAGLLLMLPLVAFSQQQVLYLPDAIKSASAKRSAVAAARLRLDQARQTRRALGAFPAAKGLIGYSSDLRVGGNDDDLVISQPIDIFGRSKAGRAIGDAGVVRAEADLRLALNELQNDVIAAYTDAASAAERLKIARSAQATAETLLQAVRQLVDGGRLPGVQAARVAIEVERARSSANLREADLRASQHRLSAVIGRETEEFDVRELPVIEVPRLNRDLLLTRRGDLMQLSADVISAHADAQFARTSLFPELEIQGRRSPWRDSDPVYGARIQLSFPLWDSGRSRAENRAASLKEKSAQRALEDASRIATADIEATRIELDAAEAQVASYSKIIDSTQSLLDKAQLGLREGANTLLDVLDALRVLREVEEALVDAKVHLITTQARFLRATGTLIEAKP
jgi:cobalt-zinc-cadmium efflux system outer membrane protein